MPGNQNCTGMIHYSAGQQTARFEEDVMMYSLNREGYTKQTAGLFDRDDYTQREVMQRMFFFEINCIAF